MPTDSMAQRLLPHLRRVARARDAETGDAQLLGEFVASHDGDAFAALVRRHGPMVLGVCRRVIGDPHLAEDAFQATFLVLARRAAVVRPRHLVGHWLYGVAYRTALKARGSAARRKAKEKQVDAMPQPPISPDEAWADLQPVLDAELARLPDKYRIPVVLCDLEGRPQREVARELRLPPATLANRLAAARRLLAKRLTDRGVALSGGAIAAALGWHAATSAVSPALVGTTVRAACAAASGTAIGLPAPVVELSEGVMRMFVLKELKAIAASAATCLVLLAGLGFVAGPSLRANPEQKPATPPQKTGSARAAAAATDSEDAVFLRRISLDLRGMLPTTLEMHYFLNDKDTKKRSKVQDWMVQEHGKQPATAMCASCHQAPWNHPETSPSVKGFFDDPDPHSEWVRDHLKQYRGSHGNYIKQVIGLSTKEDDHDTARAKVAVEQSRAAVNAAQATLHVAEAEAKRGRDNVDELRGKVEQAKANLAAAQAQLKLAEAQAAQADDVARLKGYRLRLSNLLTQDQIAKGLDRLLVEQWESALGVKTPNDLDFFRRVSLDLRGFPPTKVEENYFLEDKDPKKREKLLALMAGKSKGTSAREKFVDELLSDPAVQARWVQLWKERIAKESQMAALEAWVRKPGDRLDRLLSELLSSKKTDEQIVEALFLATLARFPTATERKLILDGVKSQPDRTAAWQGVVRALAATDEAKAHAESLSKRAK
jgi:RNA polymerase sigma factor (sigma-70 family)